MLPRLSQSQAKRVRSLQVKKYRDREGLFWIEGQRLCDEALASNAGISYGIVDEGFDSTKLDEMTRQFGSRNIPLYMAKFQDLAATPSPQGIGCVLPFIDNKPDPTHARRLIMIDGLQDPGNLGTIIRTAEWFGFDGLVTGSDCADIYNPKVIRSCMGAIFHIPFLEKEPLHDYITTVKAEGFRMIGSELKLPVNPPEPAPEKLAVLIGSEASGIDPSLYSLLDYNILIPGLGKSESLNAAVAAGIIMYTLNSGSKHG